MGARGGRGPRFVPPRVPAPGLGAYPQQNGCACSGRSPPRPGSRGRRARTRRNGCQREVPLGLHPDTCPAPPPLLCGVPGLRSPTTPAPLFLRIPSSSHSSPIRTLEHPTSPPLGVPPLPLLAPSLTAPPLALSAPPSLLPPLPSRPLPLSLSDRPCPPFYHPAPPLTAPSSDPLPSQSLPQTSLLTAPPLATEL